MIITVLALCFILKLLKRSRYHAPKILIQFYIFIETRRLAWDEAQIDESESVQGNKISLKF